MVCILFYEIEEKILGLIYEPNRFFKTGGRSNTDSWGLWGFRASHVQIIPDWWELNCGSPRVWEASGGLFSILRTWSLARASHGALFWGEKVNPEHLAPSLLNIPIHHPGFPELCWRALFSSFSDPQKSRDSLKTLNGTAFCKVSGPLGGRVASAYFEKFGRKWSTLCLKTACRG